MSQTTAWASWPSGDTETATLTHVVTAGDLGTTITNIATADSDQTGEDTDTNSIPVGAPALNITKTNDSTTTWADADSSGDLSVGDTITYTYTVTNTGTANLTNVTVEDDLLGAATLSDVAIDGVGFLAIGDTETATLTHVVTTDDLGTTITNIATADSDQTGEDTDTNSIPVGAPALNITKTNDLTTTWDDADSSGDLSVGDTITYTYEVTNTGGANLTNVTVEDDLLGAATLSDVAVDGVGFLAAGDTETATLTHVVTTDDLGTTITNIATADSDQTGEDTDTNSIPVGAPALNITKTNDSTTTWDDADSSGDLSVGDTITYTYEVTNTGGANLTNVTVEDDLLGAATLSDVAVDGVGFLAAGDTETATLTHVVTTDDLGTTITNIATADSDQTGEDTDTNSIPVGAPALNITKTKRLPDVDDADNSGDLSGATRSTTPIR